MTSNTHSYDPLQPHAHDPNPEPPSEDAGFSLAWPGGRERAITVADLAAMPQTRVANCYIVSTGHGTSGPFVFGGVTLADFVRHTLEPDFAWKELEVISGDGFGNRVTAQELAHPDPAGPILLSLTLDGQSMTRQQGLVRLIVPSERDDALRQVKWVGRINIR